MKQKREALNQTVREEMAVECTGRVLALPVYKEANEIYIYISYQKELETRYLIKAALRAGKKVAAPRITGKEIEFFYFDNLETMQKNKYGILEPLAVEKAEKDEALIIMPGVAFDEQRNRIGYGGGFYDRYLGGHPANRTIAVAYDFQILDRLPSEEFDQKPEAIVTEKRTIF